MQQRVVVRLDEKLELPNGITLPKGELRATFSFDDEQLYTKLVKPVVKALARAYEAVVEDL